MAGTDENVAMIGDWTPPNPSPRTFISNFLNEEYGSRPFADLLTENGNEGPGSDKQKLALGPKVEDDETSAQNPNNLSSDPHLFGAHKSSSQGGLAERMAARAGFNVPKLNMARISPANTGSSSSEVRSPYLTIPPGLSPTTLLESPVFLSNSMAQPSPTTGKFLFAQHNNSIPISVSAASNKSEDHALHEILPEAFAFKPHLEPNSLFYPTAEKKIVSSVGQQQQQSPSIEVPAQSENPGQALTKEAGTMKFQNQQEISLQGGFSDSSDRKDTADDIFNQKMSDSFAGNEHSPPPDDHQDGEGEQKGEPSSVALGTPAEDGYNWRKYGQKQVKGSEFPRSYYKCTHPNCQVKKKVERSHEGHITEIIYKGAHNHPKPPPNRRSGVPSSHPFNDSQIYGSEHPPSQASFDGKPLWPSSQNGTGSHDWRADGVEATSSASAAAEFCDPTASVQTQDGPRFETSDAIDVSSTLSNEEEEDDRATHGSVSLGGDGEGDETESKRRKLDACAIEMSAASRAVREPRVVVQTTSEVDILDDGYRWRKYGQKVVKGNPNPRSYYKCTNPGCTVRKHVERASHDLKSVITTYEGKHNHDVPAARNTNHANSAPSSTVAMAPPQPHSLLRRPEPTQDGLVRYEGPTPPLSAYGLPGRDQLGPSAAFSFGMGQQGLTNIAMAGLGHMAPMKMPVLPPVHPYLAHRRAPDGGFMMPKGEPKEEPMSESRLPMPNGGSVYHQMMSRLPLGPQL